MSHNIYIYILVMAAVTYLIRMLPLALSRKEIIRKSLDNYGYILVADTMQDAIDTVNEIASEHLELVTKKSILRQ